ncbi:hypothetical protein [Phyllobacterium sp. OV277]|uniref:hypothetical protein n=1 Tax=Phyllobacterium sp. OV277 TaxID=1882772 RepID=UPI000880B528|nr:hypothetical protein [Phyllobacterium sp. OV277]SDP09009.1 hypothetical protein SAMN05443582_103373 [Phyllobacterium sp. OV277]
MKTLSQNGMVATETGWLILNGMGRRWDGHLYLTPEAAELTAKCCVSGSFSILSAKRVKWVEVRTPNKQVVRQQYIIEGKVA